MRGWVRNLGMLLGSPGKRPKNGPLLRQQLRMPLHAQKERVPLEHHRFYQSIGRERHLAQAGG